MLMISKEDKILSAKRISANGDFVGNKAEGLLFLQDSGFRVPDFYVLPFATLQSVLKGEKRLENLIDYWKNECQIEEDSIWAVRSSASVEDGGEKSYAGLFSTRIDVPLKDLKTAILSVLEAYQKVGESQYAESGDMIFGIIIQQMILPDYSGVIFSHNPLDVTDDTPILNVVPGVGEELVSGRTTAYTVKKEKTDWVFPDDKTVFEGKTIADGLQEITKTGETIKRDIQDKIKVLFHDVRRMSKLKKHPVDVEFCISGGRIYYLQIRPITAIGEEHEKVIAIWDNSNIGENYPGITLPLTASFVRFTYQKAYSKMAEFVGMSQKLIQSNMPYFGNMAGSIHGGIYYNITSWQKLLYQFPFGKTLSRQITKILGMDDAVFEPPSTRAGFFGYLTLLSNLIRSFFGFNRIKKAYLDNFNKVYSEYQSKDYLSKSHSELVSTYNELEQKLGDNWIAPMINGFFAMVLFTLLKKAAKDPKISSSYPNFANDILFSQGDVISVAIVRALHHILNQINNSRELSNLFLEKEPSEIISELIKKHPALKREIDTFIRQYGERCEEGELKMETINYKEDPLTFIRFLKANTFYHPTKKATEQQRYFDYEKVLKTAYPYRPVKRWYLKKVIRFTISRVKDRENFRFIRTQTFALIRKIFRGIDASLLQTGRLSEKGDSLYLHLQELLDTSQKYQYKEIIKDRKKIYQKYEKIEKNNRYQQTEKGFVPVYPAIDLDDSSVIRGTGCSSGIIEGEVVIIHKNTTMDRAFSGKILVAKHFEPGWITLFSTASGLVSEQGSLLSHTAILSRELGIPTIVGANGLLSKVKDGDRVRLNGAKGELLVLKNNDNV